jgi:hypothetical protein
MLKFDKFTKGGVLKERYEFVTEGIPENTSSSDVAQKIVNELTDNDLIRLDQVDIQIF